jgi:hypothetical protein
LLGILARHDPFDSVAFVARSALESIGPPVLEPALAAHAAAVSDRERFSLEGVLADIRVRDDRVLAVLLKVLERDPSDGAVLLDRYGDPAALPRLFAALDRCCRIRGGGPRANPGVLELAEAIENLLGMLGPTQETRVLEEELDRLLTFALDLPPTPPRPRAPGRNAPCPCGSGRKFKKCCMD